MILTRYIQFILINPEEFFQFQVHCVQTWKRPICSVMQNFKCNISLTLFRIKDPLMTNVWWIMKVVVYYQNSCILGKGKNSSEKKLFCFSKRKAHFSHLHKYRISMQKVIEKWNFEHNMMSLHRGSLLCVRRSITHTCVWYEFKGRKAKCRILCKNSILKNHIQLFTIVFICEFHNYETLLSKLILLPLVPNLKHFHETTCVFWKDLELRFKKARRFSLKRAYKIPFEFLICEKGIFFLPCYEEI